MKRRSSWLMKKFRYFFQYRLTPVGQMAVLLMFLSASGLITVEIPVYLLFCGIVVLFGAVEFTGSAFRPKLRLSAVFPEKVTAGDTLTGLVTIKNLGFFPAFDLMCGCFMLPDGIEHTNPRAMIPSLGRGEQAVLPVTLKVARRGQFAIPSIWIHSTFPLNFMRVGNAPVPFNKLTVVPAFHRLERLETPISHRYQHGGMLLESRSGNAAEYTGNREYIPGEPTKRLDFRAWARVGKPVVREYQDEFCARVAIVLDTQLEKSWLGYRQPERNQLEAAINLTAAVADELDHLGTTIELFAAGPELFLFQSDQMGTSSLDSILEVLAGLEPATSSPFGELNPLISEALESTSVVICLFLDWDDQRQQLVNQVIRSGCGVRVFLVRKGATQRPFPEDEVHSQLSPEAILQGEACLL